MAFPDGNARKYSKKVNDNLNLNCILNIDCFNLMKINSLIYESNPMIFSNN